LVGKQRECDVRFGKYAAADFPEDTMLTLHRSIISLFFALVLGAAGALAAGAGPSAPPATLAPLLEDAAAATKSASASDDKAKALDLQKGAETASFNVKKAAHAADQAALSSAYQSACPQGYPPERKAQCEQTYQTYVSNYTASSAQFTQNVFQPSLQRWNALDAQAQAEKANALKQRAAAQRALAVLSKFFPGCPIGSTAETLEATVDCMHRGWDGGQAHDPLNHAPLPVNGNVTPFVWNDANASVKQYHDQFNIYSKAQAADETLLNTLESQPYDPDRNMQIQAVKQRMSTRTNNMAFLKYQAGQSAK
jgi:hypothetical protein